MCFFVNERWNTDTTLISQACPIVLETLANKCRSFYLPGDFTSIILVAVYITPQAAAATEAAQQPSAHIMETENSYPDSTALVLREFNHVNLKRTLPRFRQQIHAPTRYWINAIVLLLTPFML